MEELDKSEFMRNSIYIAVIATLLLSGCKNELNEEVYDYQLTEIGDLDGNVTEASGLFFIDKELYAHNDSGKGAFLYNINKSTAATNKAFKISDTGDTKVRLRNWDWEDITTQDDNIFIGDFGNNSGARPYFSIYKIKSASIINSQKSIDLNDTNNVNATATKEIRFNYEGRAEAPYEKDESTDYDCEAMFVKNNKIYLFTKNHSNSETTNIYTLPSTIEEGNFTVTTAAYVGAEHTGMLVTGADISNDGKKVVLIGYTRNLNPKILLYTNFEGNDFFSGDVREINWENPPSVQIEGVVFSKDSASIYIASEQFNFGKIFIKPRLYNLKF